MGTPVLITRGLFFKGGVFRKSYKKDYSTLYATCQQKKEGLFVRSPPKRKNKCMVGIHNETGLIVARVGAMSQAPRFHRSHFRGSSSPL